MLDLVKQHLHRAQHRMKDQADKRRSDRVFQPGDRVFLKLQPYVQTSVAQRACHKLAFKFFGPYTVLAKIGAVAYRLQVPEGSLVHPVFHVSRLKPAHLRPEQRATALPSDALAFQVPLEVLQYRWRKKANKMVCKARSVGPGRRPTTPPGKTWRICTGAFRVPQHGYRCASSAFATSSPGADLSSKASCTGRTVPKTRPSGKISTAFDSASLMHRLGDKPFFKGRGLSAALQLQACKSRVARARKGYKAGPFATGSPTPK